MSKTVAILGSGQVGDALAKGFFAMGYRVVRGTREPQKMAAWVQANGAAASAATFADAAAAGDIVVLAVKGTAAEACIESCAAQLAGKTVLDATNPIADAPPEQGVLRYFTTMNESLMERLQKLAPSANFVKAFSSVGNGLFVNPQFAAGKPTMFIAGNDAAAKAATTEILTAFGWETADMGPAVAARAIEPLCMLWCIPGFAKNQWHHAFKLLQA
jgi:hypothetical protein